MSVKEGVDVDVEKVSGNGNINMEDAENLGSFTAENAAGAELNVQATDKDGNVKNADGVDAATLTKMRAQVQATDATVTASAAEGDVNGAISIDAKGNVSTAKNTLMDAALKQASITTVALDKILTNDVRKRLGDIRSDKNQTGVWMRWDGGKLKGDGLTNNFNTIQIGGDTKVGTNCRIGVAGSFTHGDTDFARGNGELEGFSFALYSTWMGENGMFADIVTRLGHFSNEMNVEGRKGDMDNRVFSLSGEYGWRFDLCKQFFLEPQVELAYTYVSSDDLQLGTARYAFDNVNSLVGRAGLVAGWNLPDDMGNVYARASVLQQFMGDAKISGSNGNAFNVQEIDGNDTWMEYGIGANVKLTEKTYIWADVERTAGADLDEEWRGTVGVRFSF
ncbi:MAG: autotransporter outer membrane beta-barrel domain-containing protein [Mailhella sp.]|nr:autotransporter outer membrane beta-barrel domain-containing protein [Mailhella sp.]